MAGDGGLRRAGLGIALLVAVVGAVMLWIFGPLVRWAGGTPLVDPGLRLLAAVGLIGLVLLAGLIMELISSDPPRRARRRTLQTGTTGQGRGNAVTIRPWALVIGPGGAGTSRLVERSGLTPSFDTADLTRRAPAKTKLLASEEIVLVDMDSTAIDESPVGRQEVAPLVRLVGRIQRLARPDPISAVILVLDLPQMIDATALDRRTLVGEIRSRLLEVGQVTKSSQPIYLVLSQADQLIGYNATAQALGNDSGLIGWTFDHGSARAGPTTRQVSGAVNDLVGHLTRRQNDVLHRLREQPARWEALLFLRRLDSLRDSLTALIGDLIRRSRFRATPQLRGFYLMAGGIGDDTTVSDVPRSALERYDLAPIREALSDSGVRPADPSLSARLINSVVLRETRWVQHRRFPILRLLTTILFLIGLAFCIALGAVLGAVGHTIYEERGAVRQEMQAIGPAITSVVQGPITGSDPLSTVSVLNRILDASSRVATPRSVVGPQILMDQVLRIVPEPSLVSADAWESVYHETLTGALLPRIGLRLEEALAAMIADGGVAAETEAAYRSLVADIAPDPSVVSRVAIDLYGRDFGDPLPEGLLTHIGSLFALSEFPVLTDSNAELLQVLNALGEQTTDHTSAPSDAGASDMVQPILRLQTAEPEPPAGGGG